MKIHALLVACAVFLAGSVASASVTVTLLGVTGGDPDALGVGETVTAQLLVTNPEENALIAIGLSAFGYDEAVADFDSGAAVPNLLNAFCPAPGQCFGGLDNLVGGALAETTFGGNPNRVNFVIAATAGAAVSNVGTGLDQGLDNQVGTSQFDITFVGVANGSTTITFGTGFPGDEVVLEGGVPTLADNAMLTITVPEPGAIAAGGMALASVLGMAGIRRRL